MLKTKIIGLSLVFVVFIFAGFGCKKTATVYTTNLAIWGVFDNQQDYEATLRAYAAAHPYVQTANYRKFTIESYKKDLLSALAAGNGPDIFMIHNTWLPEFQDKVMPAPQSIISEQEFRSTFVDVAAADGMIGTDVYAVPLSVDSLALYYNKDVFNAAGITSPPKTWEEFNDVVKQLTRVDEQGRIVQSAAAMGTAYNINRSVDLLTVLMMQSGATMSENGLAEFDTPITNQNDAKVPGRDALEYYTSFARGESTVYTWNKNQHYSLDAFFEGNTAMMINYSWHYDTIVAKNAKLNFAVAPLPQIDVATPGAQDNYANYWMFVVAKNKTITDPMITNDIRTLEAWEFLKALTMLKAGEMKILNGIDGDRYIIQLPYDFADEYLTQTGKPAARLDLIEKQKKDIRLGSFAHGNLIARSWWHKNAEEVERVLVEMINDINIGAQNFDDAIKLAAQRVTQLMKE